jgi:hypothetical protein
MLDVEFAVDCVLESDTFVDVLEGLADDVIEEEVEECWSEDTSLTDAVVDAECVRCLAIGLDGSANVGMELLEKPLEFTGESELFEDAPHAHCGTVDVSKPNQDR